jgi:anti-sigma factor RsiW
MTCDEREPLIGAYLDGELGQDKRTEIEAHIAECETCSATLSSLKTLGQTLKSPDLRFIAPKDLESSILDSLPVSSASESMWDILSKSRGVLSIAAFGLSAVCLIIGMMLGISIFRSTTPTHDMRLADEAIGNNIRSEMANHLLDITSAALNKDNSFFSSKLGYAVDVVNLASKEFPLAGGRFDYMDSKPVATLVYKHFSHNIDIYEWPAGAGEPNNEQVRTMTRDGYNLEYWRANGTTYWMVSDISKQELSRFFKLFTGAIGISSS